MPGQVKGPAGNFFLLFSKIDIALNGLLNVDLYPQTQATLNLN